MKVMEFGLISSARSSIGECLVDSLSLMFVTSYIVVSYRSVQDAGSFIGDSIHYRVMVQKVIGPTPVLSRFWTTQ